MYSRIAACVLVLAGAVGCGQSSSPVTSPSPTCSYSLSIGSAVNGYPEGGSFTVAVTTTPASGCSWTATSQASWIHVPDGAGGSGSGSFSFTVDANPGPARSGTLTAGGHIVVFNQAAGMTTPPPTCSYSLSVGSAINGYPDGGSFTVAVTTTPPTGCNWTATSQAPWIHVPEGAGGSGTGAFNFTVDANPGPARSGTLTAAGQIVVFNQSSSGTTVGSCTYSLSVGSMINGYPNGGTFPVGVTTTPPTGCSWTAVSNATWIHITSGASGSGSGTFVFVVDANPGPARAGTLAAAGEIVVFNQSSAQ